MRRQTHYAAGAVLMLAGIAAAAQAPPRDGQQAAATGTATIRGRVVQLDTDQPVRRVRIVASRTNAGSRPYLAMTDAGGRFELTTLPAGEYQLAASKGGFVTIEHGQRRPLEPGRPLVVADGQTLEDVTFTLPRGSVIAGRVFDEFGDAVTGASVQAHRYRYVNGQRQLTVAAADPSTDDLGQFRIFGLLPGEYYVSATPPGDLLSAVASLASGGGIGSLAQAPPSAGLPGYIRTYYPDTPSPFAAQPVSVGVGAESPPLAIQLVVGRMATVSGLVLGADGAASRASVVIRPSGSDPVQAGNASMAQAENGRFTLTGVVPGIYTIEALVIDPFARPPRIAHGSAEIGVSGDDVRDLIIQASFGATARGRIVFEGGDPAGVQPNQIQLGATSATPSMAAVASQVHDDWTFEIRGLAGTRTLRVTPPPPWTLDRITRGAADITDASVEFSADADDITVVLTQRTTEVSGTVRDSRGAASTDYVVVWFADDRARWVPQTRFVRTARPDQGGQYRIRGLPPGRYLAAAVEYLEPGEELDPDRLEELRRAAMSVDLGEAEVRSVDLTLSTF